jgi:hypothetical protein
MQACIKKIGTYMIKKLYLFILLGLFLCPAIAGQNKTVTLKGEVVAYVEPHLVMMPHSYVPNADVLIVRVKDKNKMEGKFIKILTEYFSEKSPLPEDIFKGGVWKFKLNRQVYCDNLLIFDLPDSERSFEKDGEIWVLITPSIKYIESEDSVDLPKNKILPCYKFISAGKVRAVQKAIKKAVTETTAALW